MDERWTAEDAASCCAGVSACFGSAAAHHSGNYYPFLMHIPGFRVVLPTTPADAKGLLKTAIRCDDPVFFLEHEAANAQGPGARGGAPDPLWPGGGAREGSDVTVVGIAYMVPAGLAGGGAAGQGGYLG